MDSCLNCGQHFQHDAKYCYQCGQKTNIRILSFWNIIRDFFSNLFNIDNKIWQTLKDIWKPAHLTLCYIQGKRVRYYNPLRIFIVTLFACFALLILFMNQGISKADYIKQELEKKFWKQELLSKFDSLTHTSEIPADTLYKLRVSVFDLKEKLNAKYKKILSDSLTSNAELSKDEIIDLKDSLVRAQLLDSIGSEFIISTDPDKSTFETSDEILEDGFFLAGIKTSDFFSLSREELVEKYGKGEWRRELMVTQVQKMFHNPSSSLKFLIGNGTWATIAVILFMALLYKLLYIRHNFLFAEHFIFQLYGHTRIMILCIIGLILENVFNAGSLWQLLVLFVGTFYMYKGMRLFYKQSRIKTLFKMSISIWSYFFIILLCCCIIFAISFVAF